jgi:hypothetical protein
MLNRAPLLAIHPSEHHATTNFLEADFRGVSGCTSTVQRFSSRCLVWKHLGDY